MANVSRRGLLAFAGALLLGAGLMGVLRGQSLLRWRPSAEWLEGRLRAAVRAAMGGDTAPMPTLAAEAYLESGACARIVSPLSGWRLLRMLSSPEALRHHLASLHSGDLRAGRTVWANGWLFSETEICVAVLAAR